MVIPYRLLALDLIAAGIAVAIFTLRTEPDVLFHVVWVVLVIEAFAYGLRVTAPRIGIAAALVVLYALSGDWSDVPTSGLVDMLFSEWPLMLVIITIVAVMADRVTTTSRNLANLERQTHEHLVTAREDERRRLSADLHDGLGQTLSALVLTLDAAEATLVPDHADAAAGAHAIQRAQEITATALDETHEVTRRLRPVRLKEIGLTTAIRDLAANAGRPIEVEFDPRLATSGLLPVDDEMQAYRIVQEAVGNAVRHASARTISIVLHVVRGSRLQIDVVDDGLGFDRRQESNGGLGLQGMAERAAAIGGSLSLESGPGTGTRVRLQVPLRSPLAFADS
jgi:signal transduction histidine kinase